MGRTNKKGFTLIELLVVIAIIALLLSIILPALGRAKEYAQRILCSNNLKQQALGIILYAEQNNSETPGTHAGWWFWDMSFWTSNQIKEFAGFDDNKTFFCPAHPTADPQDARYWQFSILTGTHPNPVTIRDESTYTANQMKYYNYRVIPYVYMLERWQPDPDRPGNFLPYLQDNHPTLATGQPARWISKLSGVRNAGSTEMVTDAVISGGSIAYPGGPAFFELTDGGIDGLSGDMLFDHTNHRSRQSFTTGSYRGPVPSGGNHAYADGHVSWVPFGQANNPDMNLQLHLGMQFWW